MSFEAVDENQLADLNNGSDSGGVENNAQSGGAGGYLILLMVWAAGIGLLTAVLYGSVWLFEQFDILSGNEPSPLPGIIITLLLGALVALPALWASRRTHRETIQAVLETWAAAGLLVVFFTPVRLAPVTAGQSGALLQIGCAVLFLMVARRLFPAPPSASATSPYWTAVVAAALVGSFWVVWGAAGSWLDTTLNLIAAMLLGWSVATIFRRRLLPTLRTTDEAIRGSVALGGLAMGAALAAIGGGFGTSGQQLILMVLLPALGWLLMGIAAFGRGERLAGGWAAVGLAVGLVAAAPMILVDQEELLLILNLGSQDVGYWAVQATVWGSLVALLLGLLAVVFARRLPKQSAGRLGRAAAATSVGLLATLYLWTGQPGFHGERLFVIMRDQTQWPKSEPAADYWAHRQTVYDDLVNQADTSQATIRATLDRYGVDYTPYYLANAMEVDGGPLLRLWLNSRPEVDRILVSPRLRPLPEPPPMTSDTADPPTEPQWNLTTIGAPQVWQTLGVTGKGIVIGQADSGAELSHPELTRSYRGNQSGGPAGDTYNWFDPWTGSAAPRDIGGHGTHTLGSIVGETVGVAPDATWIACVNLERNLGNPALYLDCLQFLFAPFPQNGDPLTDGRPDLGAHVFNNSWGCPEIEGCDPDALLAAVQALRAAGVFVVASAGNDGDACSTVSSPIALYDEVFSVGAVDIAGDIASFSSRGPVTVDGSGRTKPDIAAPGVDVLSSYPGGTYSVASGTSMAGPHVVGVVALLWSANPDLIGDIDRTEELITSTAHAYEANPGIAECGVPGVVPDNVVGYGLIDAFAAVQAALDSR